MLAKPVRILTVLVGHALPEIVEELGDFPALYERAWAPFLPAGLRVLHEVHPGCDEETRPWPRPTDHDGVIVSGSAAMVDEQPSWLAPLSTFVVEALHHRIPLLGVCFGHQAVAHALGGTVGRTPGGRFIGSTRVNVVEPTDPLFFGLPETFTAQATHRDSVPTLPGGARLIATAPHCEIFAFRVAATVWGVQFHPEFDAGITRRYLRERAALLDEERGAGTASALLDKVVTSPHAGRVLSNFVAFCYRQAQEERG